MINQIEDDRKIDLEALPQWFVCRTNRNQERLAAASLTAAKLEAYLPIMLKTGRREALIGPMFPSFVFVRLAIGAPGWTSVFRARGVKSLMLAAGGQPAPLHERAITRMKSQEHAGYISLLPAAATGAPCPYKPGDRLKIQVGTWANLEAVFHERIDSKRCAVLIQLLGDSQRIAKIELAHLASASADAIKA